MNTFRKYSSIMKALGGHSIDRIESDGNVIESGLVDCLQIVKVICWVLQLNNLPDVGIEVAFLSVNRP